MSKSTSAVQPVLKSFLFALIMGASLIVTGCLNSSGGECTLEPDLDVNQAQLEADVDSIDAYLESNDIDAQVHPSGIRYVINEQGSGAKPTICDLVVVNYEGRFLESGEVFDSSSSPVQLAVRNLITGWQVGIPLLQTGGTITLYIPSGLAYGERGAGDVIPPDANLIFEIELF